MTLIQTYTCDYCNPERTTTLTNEHEGVGEWRGWAKVMGDGIPTGWWPVPEKGADGKVGHACAHCMTQDQEVIADVRARRQAETERMTGMKIPPREEEGMGTVGEWTM